MQDFPAQLQAMTRKSFCTCCCMHIRTMARNGYGDPFLPLVASGLGILGVSGMGLRTWCALDALQLGCSKVTVVVTQV